MRRGADVGLVWAVAAAMLGGLGGCRAPEGVPGAGSNAGTKAPPPPVAVSLTFDDGWDDVWRARELLAARGLRATFYIISGHLGTVDYLTRAQVDQLAADGHEIGGHTITHRDLTTLEPPSLRREICDDRAALIGLGYDVHTFAYPFGAANPAVEAMAAQCGYRIARGVGGLRVGAECRNCPPADTVPPGDTHFVETPGSIVDHTSLADITALLDAAEAARSSTRSWLPLVMHHVCDDCDPLTIRPAILGALLDRLAADAAAGRVVVLPVAEVAGLIERHPG